MQCKILNCDREAKLGFEACDVVHGTDLKRYRSDLSTCWNAIENNKQYTMRSQYSLEEAITYLT